eukprot:878438-Prorocentrum_minimum.AAC.2
MTFPTVTIKKTIPSRNDGRPEEEDCWSWSIVVGAGCLVVALLSGGNALEYNRSNCHARADSLSLTCVALLSRDLHLPVDRYVKPCRMSEYVGAVARGFGASSCRSKFWRLILHFWADGDGFLDVARPPYRDPPPGSPPRT